MRLEKFNFKFSIASHTIFASAKQKNRTRCPNFFYPCQYSIINFFLSVIRTDLNSSFVVQHYFIFHSSCSIFENLVLTGIVSARSHRLKGN